MSTVKFSCEVGTNNADVPLGLEIWIDNTCVVDIDHVSTSSTVEHEFDDDDGERVLRLILKNKLSEHTEIDDAGNIVSDARLTVTNISFDEIDCEQIVYTLAVYRHNFNGSGLDVEHGFFGELGCNGTVELKFTTPLYLWLLENM